jgi:hypothetical protein
MWSGDQMVKVVAQKVKLTFHIEHIIIITNVIQNNHDDVDRNNINNK